MCYRRIFPKRGLTRSVPSIRRSILLVGVFSPQNLSSPTHQAAASAAEVTGGLVRYPIPLTFSRRDFPLSGGASTSLIDYSAVGPFVAHVSGSRSALPLR